MNKFYLIAAGALLSLSAYAAPLGTPVLAGTESLRANVSMMKPGDDPIAYQLRSSAPKFAAPQREVTTEGKLTVTTVNGVVTDVAGVDSKFYERASSGTTYFINDKDQLSYSYQSGNVEVKEDGDVVYIKNPLTRFTQGSWVKGVKNGNTLSVATWQPLLYNPNYDACICLAWGDAANGFNVSDHSDVINFTIDGNSLVLEGTTSLLVGSGYLIGAYWNDDLTYQGYWDAETVLTYDDGYEPPTTDLVELPAGASVEGWFLAYEDANGNPVKNQEVNVAFVKSEVYVQGISADFPDSWIKGNLEGSTITFDKLQYLGTYGGAYDIWVVGVNANDELCDLTAAYDAEARTITFNESVVINAAADRIYYLDWLDNVVLSAEPEEVEVPELVELPAGASVEGWFLNYDDKEGTPVYNQDVNVAFVDNDVYVQGISAYLPEAWIKGSLNGSTVTFDKFQYLGTYYGIYEIWCVGLNANVEFCDLTATYDAAARTISFNETILNNTSKDEIYYLDWLDNAVISAEPKTIVEPVLTEEVASLPYNNTFDTEEERAQAVFYDGNHDGKTFMFVNDNGNTAARIAYNSTSDADDYLAFPGLALQAGVKYTVSLSARCQGYVECFEVVCGKVAKPSEYTIPVIDPTEVTNRDYETFGTTDFMVDEDGVYFFAIHGISEADQFYLYVDDFSVSETPELAVVLWDNSSMKYENPCVNYSVDGGNTYEGPVEMTLLNEPALADEYEDIPTPESNIYAAAIPAETTHVFFSDGDSNVNRTKVFSFEEGELYFDKIESGIDMINAAGVKAEYYNLQGIRVDAPAAGQIYIVRRGNTVVKVAK